MGEEILQLIDNEQPRKGSKGHKKKTGFHPRNMLINRLLRYEDYRPIYPMTIQIEVRNEKGKIAKHPKDLPGASSKLFQLYQSQILGVSTKSLNTAWRIADYIRKNTSTEMLEEIRKDTESNLDKQAIIRKIIVKMTEENKLSFAEYSELFLTIDRVPKLKYHTWKMLHYYLHNLDRKPELDIKTEVQLRDDNRLVYTASMIFNRILEDKGKYWFKKNVLDGFATKEVNLEWLRKQFVKSSRIHEGFSYNDWKYLVVNGDGQERLGELLYCLRVLFTEFFNKNIRLGSSITDSELIKLDTDLSKEIENSIKTVVHNYLDKYGSEKFEKQIVHQLIVKWNESLYWFKRKMKLNDEFLIDENGKDIKNLRRFQLQLLLNNEFRKVQSTF